MARSGSREGWVEIDALAQLYVVAVEVYCLTDAAEIDLYQRTSPSNSSAVRRVLVNRSNHYYGTSVAAAHPGGQWG